MNIKELLYELLEWIIDKGYENINKLPICEDYHKNYETAIKYNEFYREARVIFKREHVLYFIMHKEKYRIGLEALYKMFRRLPEYEYRLKNGIRTKADFNKYNEFFADNLETIKRELAYGVSFKKILEKLLGEGNFVMSNMYYYSKKFNLREKKITCKKAK